MTVDLSKLVKRADRAMKDVTPGPWHTEGDAPWNLTVWSSASNRVCFMAHSNGLNDDRDMATGAFIASARDLVEEMTEALTTLLAERDAAVARAEKAEREQSLTQAQVDRLLVQMTKMDDDLQESRTYALALVQELKDRAAKTDPVTDVAKRVLHDIDDLVANSEGVAGLHMNGEVADWQSLMAGGSFGSWLESVEDLRAALPADAGEVK